MKFVKGQIGFWRGKKRPYFKHSSGYKCAIKNNICTICTKTFLARRKARFCSLCQSDRNKSKIKELRKSIDYRQKQVEWNKKWHDNPKNRERVLEIRRKSQKKIISALKKVGFVTKEIRLFILKRDNYLCLCCGAKEKLTIDHIIPISKGGITEKNNLQVLCSGCNAKKQQSTTDYRIIGELLLKHFGGKGV